MLTLGSLRSPASPMHKEGAKEELQSSYPHSHRAYPEVVWFQERRSKMIESRRLTINVLSVLHLTLVSKYPMLAGVQQKPKGSQPC